MRVRLAVQKLFFADIQRHRETWLLRDGTRSAWPRLPDEPDIDDEIFLEIGLAAGELSPVSLKRIQDAMLLTTPSRLRDGCSLCYTAAAALSLSAALQPR